MTSAEQATYELLRPIVLFGQPAAARARETSIPERTLRRKAAELTRDGMRSLFTESAPAVEHDRRRLLAEIRRAIVDLKAEYPPFSFREIAWICRRRFARPVDHQTVRQVLVAEPLPLNPPRRDQRYAAIPDPIQRRMAVVRLHRAGWSTRSIAGACKAVFDSRFPSPVGVRGSGINW